MTRLCASLSCSSLTGEIGFSPERNNRYSYFTGPAAGTLELRTTTLATSTATDTSISYDAFKYADTAVFVAATLQGTPTSTCGGAVAGIVGTTWTGYALGQVDTDLALDLWSISTDTRTLTVGTTCDQGGPNPAGEHANESNDVNR